MVMIRDGKFLNSEPNLLTRSAADQPETDPSSVKLTSLLACPFCGGAAQEYIGYGENKAGCSNHQCRLCFHAFDKDFWNTRAAK